MTHDEFIKTNYEVYIPLFSQKDVVDPFNDYHHKSNLVFSRHLFTSCLSHGRHDPFWNITKICSYCGEPFTINIFDRKITKRTCCSLHKAMEGAMYKIPYKGEIITIRPFELIGFIEKMTLYEFKEWCITCFNTVMVRDQITKNTPSFFKVLKRTCPSYTHVCILNDAWDNKGDYIDRDILGIPARFYAFRSPRKENAYTDIRTTSYFTLKTWWGRCDKIKTHGPYHCQYCGKEYDSANNTWLYDKRTDKVRLRYSFCSLSCAEKMRDNTAFTESHQKLSKMLKEKISKGLFTPAIINSLTRKGFTLPEYPEYKFRSSWEALFWYVNRTDIPYHNYECIRIPYVDNKGKQRNYIIDFYDEHKRVIYEIKPTCHHDNPNVLLKMQASIVWGKQHNIRYVVIDEQYFVALTKLYDNFDFLGEKGAVLYKTFLLRRQVCEQ